jgi:integration host factor subunit alpha
MHNITKKSIASHLNSELGLSKQLLEDIVDSIFNDIIRLASRDSFIKIKNFGSFSLLQKSRRQGYIIGKKKIVEIDERVVLKLCPSKSLKERINKIQ